MKKIWFGNIPEIFGYGISCLGSSKKEVMEILKKEYVKWKKQYPDNSTTFEKSFEYYGGYAEEIEIGKGYYENLRH
jgi:hypothetical protein